MSSHCETGLVSRRLLGLLAFCQSLPCGRASGSVSLLPPRPCPRRQPRAAWFLPPQHLRRQSSPGKTPCGAGGEGCEEQGRGCMGTTAKLEHLSAREPDSGLVRV